MTETGTKPSLDIFLRWADILGQRLETVRHIYEDHNSSEAASRVSALLIRLQHILAGELERHLAVSTYAALQQAQSPERAEELQCQALANAFTLALEQLPDFSKDMQKLLNSPWLDQCNGRLATDLFKGPRNAIDEGIGSGYPRDGRLPKVLEKLLEQDQTGTGRPPRASTLSPEEQQKWKDTARRWALRNSATLRRAGRVE
ncbi:MAG: hypothetical protein WBK91_01690 [Alphaproteobacteria bacterium]